MNMSKKMAKNVLKIPRRAPKNGANFSSAFASRRPAAALSSLPEVIKCYHTGKMLYIEKFV